ncbi:unnamed protein product [Urochloa humidicola]
MSSPKRMSRETMLGDRTLSPAEGDGAAAAGGGCRGPDLTWAEVAPIVDHGAIHRAPPRRHPPRAPSAAALIATFLWRYRLNVEMEEWIIYVTDVDQ